MIFKHHRELVRPKDAKAWFAFKPAGEKEGHQVGTLKQLAAWGQGWVIEARQLAGSQQAEIGERNRRQGRRSAPQR